MIVFLDFDGVLHSRDAEETSLFNCAPALWTVLRACPDVRVVLATSWRNIHELSELVEMVCRSGGEDMTSRFVGATPHLIEELGRYIPSGGYPRREFECRAWLLGNSANGKRWLAIDDDLSGFSRGCAHLYSVDPATGLTELDVCAIIARINSKGGE